MRLEDQVCSLELAKKLKELGVKQDGYFEWVEWEDKTVSIYQKASGKTTCGEQYAAFTVAELGEMLPDQYHTWHTISDGFEKRWLGVRFSEPEFDSSYEEWFQEDTEANLRAKMLIHLIERGLVKTEKG